MKKNERGVLTVEASIVLCVFALFILFLFSFATIYRAENMVSHATLQAADAVALESYLRETAYETDEQKVLFWANRLNGQDSISADSFESLRTADLEAITKEKFALAVGETAEQADRVLKNLGVDGGLDGIDFSESYVDLTTNDIIIRANYTMKMKFPVFGANQLTASKSAKAKTAGEILFTINVIPEDKIMGITSGSGKYRMGTEVEISAEANYGFDFVSWDDGNTDNPRKITVADAKTYIAKFERHNFGVNLFISDTTDPNGRVKGSNAYGTVSSTAGGVSSVGGNEYNYESTVRVQAVDNPGYKFISWSGTKVGDSGSTSIYTTDRAFDVYMDGTYDLTAVYEPYTYTASVSTNCDAAKNCIGVRKYGSADYAKSVAVPYGNQIELNASNVNGYTFLGWYRNGSKVTGNLYTKIPLPVGGGNFEAQYEKDPTIRVVANGSGKVKVAANNKTSYCCKKGTSVKIIATPSKGYYFAGWSDGGDATHSVVVNADATYTATFKPLYAITVISGGGGTVSGGNASAKGGTDITINATPSKGYYFVKWQRSADGGKTYSDVSWSAKYTFTVNANATYKAIFAIYSYTVTLNPNGGSLKSTRSYTVNYGGATGYLPRPVKQGYRFKGWKINSTTYAAGKQVTNVTTNMTLVAQWSKCNSHTWGRCGINHYATNASHLSAHSYSHNTSRFQCLLCVDCGKFSNGKCTCSYMNSNLNRSVISGVHLCYNVGSGCIDLWDRTYKRTYNIHEELGYP